MKFRASEALFSGDRGALCNAGAMASSIARPIQETITKSSDGSSISWAQLIHDDLRILITDLAACKDSFSILVTFITYVRNLFIFPFLCLGLCLANVSFNLTYHAYVTHFLTIVYRFPNTSGINCTTAGIARKPIGKGEHSYTAEFFFTLGASTFYFSIYLESIMALQCVPRGEQRRFGPTAFHSSSDYIRK